MVKARIKEASALRREDFVPDSERTATRDELADWIERKFVAGEKDWSAWTLTDIAKEYGCSRQHVSDVLDAYFEPASAEGSSLPPFLRRERSVGDGESYEDGYREGYWDGLADALQHTDDLREWLREG